MNAWRAIRGIVADRVFIAVTAVALLGAAVLYELRGADAVWLALADDVRIFTILIVFVPPVLMLGAIVEVMLPDRRGVAEGRGRLSADDGADRGLERLRAAADPADGASAHGTVFRLAAASVEPRAAAAGGAARDARGALVRPVVRQTRRRPAKGAFPVVFFAWRI
jgi:hypothetical protein